MSVRKKSSFNTDNKQKINERGHVVLTTPFSFCLLKSFGSHAKNSAFFLFLRKRCDQAPHPLSKVGNMSPCRSSPLIHSLPFNILLNSNA